MLRSESGLPGPRANLELAQAAADVFELATHRRWCDGDHEYLALCGAIGLGRLAAGGDRSLLADLRRLAGDSRWRVREGVVPPSLRRPEDVRRVLAPLDRVTAVRFSRSGCRLTTPTSAG